MNLRIPILGGALLTAGLALQSGATPAFATEAFAEFHLTGTSQTWTVPAGVTSVDVDLCGGAGAGSDQGTLVARGGYGAGVEATIAVTPGETLQIYVGGEGVDGTGGYNGGGDAVDDLDGGGGGATDVRQGGSSLADRVLIAGGGGGAGLSDGPDRNDGGDADTVGGPGQSGARAGQGGGASAGGAGGTGTSSGEAGMVGRGGDSSQEGGGGGGGGLYGGGGGALDANPAVDDAGGGGGGSSLAGSGGTVSPLACVEDGWAVFTYEVTNTTTTSSTTTSAPRSTTPTVDPGNTGQGGAPGARPISGSPAFTG